MNYFKFHKGQRWPHIIFYAAAVIFGMYFIVHDERNAWKKLSLEILHMRYSHIDIRLAS